MSLGARLDLAALLEFANDDDLLDGLAAALANDPGPTARDVVEFLQVPTGSVFNVTPEAALEYFRAKGLLPTFSYADMIGDAHDHAFTVAKMMDVDLLSYVRKSLDEAAANGIPFKVWADELIPELQKAGWWGKKYVVDPLTGKQVLAQLGSPNRLKTIFRTNLQSAYAAGSWQSIMANADHAPWLLYDAVDDWRTRPEHRAWDGTVLPADDSWWQTHYPPNGYNCRCSVVQLTDDELDALGLKPSGPGGPDDGTYNWTNPRTGETLKVPTGLDPGFDRNSGRAYLATLRKTLSEKVALLPPSMRAAAAEGEAAAAQAAEAAAAEAKLKAAAEAKEKAAAAAAAKAEKDANAFIAGLEDVIDGAPPIKAAQLVDPIASTITAYKSLKSAGKLKGLSIVKQMEAIKAEGKVIQAQAIEAQAKLALKNEAANVQLNKILEGSTPDPGKFLIAAYKQLDKAADWWALQPAERLAKVETLAAELKAKHGLQTKLSQYKKAVQAGKTPSPSSAAAFNSLSKAEQDALLAKWAAKPAPIPDAGEVTAFNTLTTDDQFLTLKAVYDTADDESIYAYAKIWNDLDDTGKKGLITGLKNDVLKKGYIDNPGELDVVAEELIDAQGGTLGKGLKPPPPAPAAPPDKPNWTQTGPQAGSNPGGQYTDTTTGKKYYVKFMDEERMRNELLASKLYEAAGIETSELSIVEINGRRGLASAWVDDLRNYTSGKKLAATPGTKDGFVADAWLSNWDVVGPDYQNIAVTKAGRALRVDVGGALRFRAQGGVKGDAFGDTITEFNTLRNASRNPSAAATFGGMTKTELTASARKVLAIPDSELERLVRDYGPLDPAENAKLLSTLRNRRDHIKREFPEAVQGEASAFKPVAKPGEKVTVTPDELDEITRARSNGYTVRTDGGKIEGNEVLVHHYTSAAGQPSTRASLRLRGEAAKAATAKIGAIAKEAGRTAKAGFEVNLQASKNQVLQWVKGVNFNFNKGEPVRAVDLDRADTARATMRAQRTELENGLAKMTAADRKTAQAIIDDLYKWDEIIANWQGDVTVGKLGQAVGAIDLDRVPTDFAWSPATKAKPAPKAIQWVRKDRLLYNGVKFDRGHAIETSSTTNALSTHEVFEATLPDGTKIRFVSANNRNGWGTQGQVYIDTVGQDAAAVNRLFRALEELDVSPTRTTELEAAERYLDAYARLQLFKTASANRYSAYTLLNQEASEAVRVANKLKFLKAETGIDIETTDGWKTRYGVQSGFGHGYNYIERPDTNTAAWRDMEASVTVFHNPGGLGTSADGDYVVQKTLRNVDSGGAFLSQMDRTRRGVGTGGGAGEGSQATDAERGGSAYVFTRIMRASHNQPGIYWKSKVLRRMDAVSYTGDTFGDVRESHLRSARKTTPAELKKMPGNHGNETLFRGSLDMFHDLDKIVVESASQKKELIDGLRARGYTRWPDGRSFDDVIKVYGR